MSRRLWIEWGTQRRNQALSKSVGARLFRFDLRHRPLLRYPVSLFMTLFMLVKERPKTIVVQNPSLVLTLFALFYGRLLGTPVIVDAHNEGLHPVSDRSRWLTKLALYMIKHASLTIVTNDSLKRYVEDNGGAAFVLPDPIYEVECPRKKLRLNGKCNVLFVCTYAADEPYQEVIEAARELGDGVCVYITGNPGGKEREIIQSLPSNVILTGYLTDSDYFNLLAACDIVMDLTTRDNCLVCGAYEAVAAEKPMILSGSKALRDYFYKGALFTDNTAMDLTRTIIAAIAGTDRLKKEVIELKRERTEMWSQCIAMFRELLDRMETRGISRRAAQPES